MLPALSIRSTDRRKLSLRNYQEQLLVLGKARQDAELAKHPGLMSDSPVHLPRFSILKQIFKLRLYDRMRIHYPRYDVPRDGNDVASLLK